MGAINEEGNVTPVAEFNCYADAVAAARVFALTSPAPSSTMPPAPPSEAGRLPPLPPYPTKLPRPLKLTLFPLDITLPHLLNKGYFTESIQSSVDAGSPLARWCQTFMAGTFNKIDSILGDGSEPGLSLHDPLCIWYMLLRDDPSWKAVPKLEDIRIETSGQWTRGMHVIDRRGRSSAGEQAEANVTTHTDDPLDQLEFDEVSGDTMGWLSIGKGNRINRIVGSPGEEEFAPFLMKRLFG